MKYQVMPELTPIEYEALKADIAINGVLVPVEVDENGELLDGHHRVKAWKELCAEGLTLPTYPKMIRSGWTEEQKRNHARRLNVLRRQLSKEQQREIMRAMREDGATLEEVAAAVGVDPSTVQRATKSAFANAKPQTVTGKDGKTYPTIYAPRKPEPPQHSMFDPGGSVALEPKAAEQTVKAIKDERREEIRQKRVDKINEIARGNAPLETPKSYPVIYADPPWRYEHSKTVSREIENQYPTMTLEEICQLPVSLIASQDAVLFMWATSPKLAEAMQVVEAWGFTYRTCMVWDKERIGMGYYARQQHELLLVCARGSLPVPQPANRPASVVRIARDPEHSVKPQEFYQIIEQMYPEYERVELFARNQREGWAAWGNQAC